VSLLGGWPVDLELLESDSAALDYYALAQDEQAHVAAWRPLDHFVDSSS